MIPAWLRKEAREQLVPWLGLALTGVLIFTLVPRLADPKSRVDQQGLRFLLPAMAVALAWVYGLICGAMLLAGEQETGTQDFLDQLPAGRWHLWRSKAFAGAMFLLGQVILMTMLIVLGGRYDQTRDLLGWILAVLVAGLFG
ncbi:MAG: hypothetical protein ACKO23_03100, partial [Gemmataceae bacterium]